MTTTLRRCRSVALAAVLTIVATPTLAQPIQSGSQDALEAPDDGDFGAPQHYGRPSISESARRRYYPGSSGVDAASPDLPATLPQPRGYGYAQPYGGYGTGYNGAYRDQGDAYGDGRTSQYDQGRAAQVAPFGGGPGNQTPIPLGAGSLYSGSAVNGTASGPQFSNQLPAPQSATGNGRFRR